MTNFDSKRWQELSPLLDQVLDLPPADRPAWFATVRKQDATLATDLEELVREHATLDDAGFLSGSAVPEQIQSSLAGLVVGSYTLRSPLGQGGMGSVWLADRSDGRFEGVAAVKLLNASLIGREGEARFQREGSLLARVRHPNISQLIDAGVSTLGQPYLVIEHVDGERIDHYCAEAQLGIAERVRLFLDVLAAVAFAHTNLIVHRDLKPHNVLVTKAGQVKLLDFGIAKLVEAEDGGQGPELTQLGGHPMTPLYASPEQISGEPQTTVSDVYSLGVMLYELLTGDLPYRLESKSLAQIREAISSREPLPASRTALRDGAAPLGLPERTRLSRELRGDLDCILLKALEKEPGRRYPSADAFARDLERYLAGQPVEARKPSQIYRAKKFLRRHVIGAALAATMMIAVLASLGFALFQRNTATQQRDRAERVSTFLTSLFDVADPTQSKGQNVTAREILDRGVETVDHELVQEPEVQAALQMTMGDAYQGLGLLEPAQALYEKALATRRQVLGPDDPDTMVTANSLGLLLQELGQMRESETLLREVLEQHRRVLGSDHANTLNALNDLGIVIWRQGRAREAEPLFRECIERKRRAFGADHESVLPTLSTLALVLRDGGRFEEAERLLREVGENATKQLGPDNPGTLTTHLNHALSLVDLGRIGDAEPLMRHVVERRQVVFGADHWLTHFSEYILGNCHRNLARLDESGRELRSASKALDRLLGPDNPRALEARNGLGAQLIAEGRSAEAEALLRESIAAQIAKLGADHHLTLSMLGTLGIAYLEQSKFKEAEQTFTEVRERARKAGDHTHAEWVATFGLIECGLRQGRASEFVSLAHETLELVKSSNAADAIYIGRAFTEAGRALAAVGRLSEAEPLLLEAHERLSRAHPWHARDAATSLAELYERSGKLSSAQEWRRKATGQ